MADLNNDNQSAEYTSIDLNSTGATTVYDPSDDSEVSGVYLNNGGSTAEVQLEATDGSDTSILAVPGAGNSLEFSGTALLDSGDSLQINVTTAEGAALTGTAVVFRAE